MNGTKKIVHQETIHESQPSAVALENEKRVTSLEEGQKDVVKSIGDIVVWMRKLEAGQESIALALNAKLDKLTNKPASTYLGAISILMGAIGSAAALIVFVQDARLEPIRAEMKMIHQDDDRSFEQWVHDYEMMIRNNERINHLDGQDQKNYTRPQLPKRHNGRPS